ncbi:MAG TPA: ComEA family DNA-binding protein [Chloroflexia bacterium]|nr:ComEA family DNA-binding protein [Chloroflexia bacterium]
MVAWIMARRVGLGLGLLALCVTLGSGLILRWGTAQPPSDATLVPPARPTAPVAGQTPSAALTVAAAPAPGSVTVYVTGAVVRPGVYTLPAGARVADLLALAGGPAPGADMERTNLAARLADAEHLTIPHLGTQGPVDILSPIGPATAGLGVGPGATKAPALLLNINTADEVALAVLPGIGPALAARIVAYRVEHGLFARLEAVQDVPGIGPKLFERMRPYISLGP